MSPLRQERRDVIIVVADVCIKAAVDGLLDRPRDLGIRPIRHSTEVHIQRDPGCYRHGPDHLADRRPLFDHGLVMFDHQGCGREKLKRERIEQDVERRLKQSGWDARAVAAVCIAPELESWVWSASPEVATALGWSSYDELRQALAAQGLWASGKPKPKDPKAAMDWALRTRKIVRNAGIYHQLARTVTLDGCTDAAFLRFKEILRTWFPERAM